MQVESHFIKTQEKSFPSDELFAILSRVQTRNAFATWEEETIPGALRQNIRDAIYCVIRYTVRAIERNENPDRDIDLSRDGTFYHTFATELLYGIVSIIGPLTDDEEDAILRLMYVELIDVCHEYTFRGNVNHEFTYVGDKESGKFVIQHMM